MTDTDTANAKRVKASERLLLNAAGEDAAIEAADRAVYKIPANGRSIEYVFGQNPIADKCFAFFGFHTKIGNVANTVRNDKDSPGTPDDEADAITEFMQSLMDSNQWREPGEGPRGPKYDIGVLAMVLHLWLADKAKGEVADYAARLETEKGYRQKVLSNDAIKALYWQEMAKRGVEKPVKSADSLA